MTRRTCQARVGEPRWTTLIDGVWILHVGERCAGRVGREDEEDHPQAAELPFYWMACAGRGLQIHSGRAATLEDAQRDAELEGRPLCGAELHERATLHFHGPGPARIDRRDVCLACETRASQRDDAARRRHLASRKVTVAP